MSLPSEQKLTEDAELRTSDATCIIGAGPSGLAVAGQLRARSLPLVILEREDDVGGNWYYGRPTSSVFASTHLISSKRMTEFPDFPMPKEFPPYPSHWQAHAYLRDYARHHRLYDEITFQTEVTSAKLENNRWTVQDRAGNRTSYPRLIVASGHHWDPLIPTFPGEFTGAVVHAHDYKTPDILAGKRVLVIGGGNSGCDLAVEAALYAKSAHLSLRRGYHFLPKFLLGGPTDSGGERLHRWGLPLALRRWITKLLLYVAVGPIQRYGLPRPDHDLFETHPIINSQLPYFVGHGRVQVRPGIDRFEGSEVLFQDGSREAFDLVLLATGYKVSFPFFSTDHVFGQSGRCELYLQAFHRQISSLMFAGLMQPNSGLWGLSYWQGKLMAQLIEAEECGATALATFRQKLTSDSRDLRGGIRFVDSPRHQLEVEYFAYRRTLQALIGQMELQLARDQKTRAAS